MALSTKNLVQVTATLPPRILCYGQHGLGKTTLGAEFPAPVFIQIEDGTPSDLTITSFGLLKSFEQVMEAIAALYQEKHDRKTVVLDSLDKLEPLVFAHTCKVNRWDNIEAPGFGKGYVAAEAIWRELLEGLNALRNDRGMIIFLIAHSEIERIDDPTTVSYSRFDIRLHRRARALVQDDVDAIIFLNQEPTIKVENQGFNKTRAHAEGGLQRWIMWEARPNVNAKNRFGAPGKLLFKKGEGFKVLAPYLPGLGLNNAANDNKPAQSQKDAA